MAQVVQRRSVGHVRRGRAVLSSLLLVAAAGSALTACGPADKQAAVRQVKAAARATDIRVGTLELSSSPEKLPAPPAGVGGPGAGAGGGLPSIPGGAAALANLGSSAPAAPKVVLGVVVDVARQRAALVAPAAVAARVGVPSPSGGAPALVLFDGATTYVRRPTQGVVGARPWYRLDTSLLRQLTEPELQSMLAPRTFGDLAVLSPLTLLEEGSGLLTGSVQKRVDETITTPSGTSVQTSRIAANVSLEKTTRSYRRDADTRRDTELLLRAFAIHDDINPSQTWLDVDGKLARFQVTYRSRPERGARIGVRYDLSLEPIGAAPPVEAELLELPTKADTVGVSTLSQLRSALSQWLTPTATTVSPATLEPTDAAPATTPTTTPGAGA